MRQLDLVARFALLILLGFLAMRRPEPKWFWGEWPILSEAEIADLTAQADGGSWRAAQRLTFEYTLDCSGRVVAWCRAHPEPNFEDIDIGRGWRHRWEELEARTKREAQDEWNLANQRAAAGEHVLAVQHFRAANAMFDGLLFDPTPELEILRMDWAESLTAVGEVREALTLAEAAEHAAPDAFPAGDARRERASRLALDLRARVHPHE
jgi:hypothetical protein